MCRRNKWMTTRLPCRLHRTCQLVHSWDRSKSKSDIYQLKRKEDRRKSIGYAEKQRNMFFVSGRWEIWLAGSLHTFQKILPYNVWESKAKDIISKQFIHTFLSLWSCETKFNHLDGCIGWTECSEAPSVQFRQAPRSPWTRVGKITVLKNSLTKINLGESSDNILHSLWAPQYFWRKSWDN